MPDISAQNKGTGAVVSLLTACTATFASLTPSPFVVNISGRFDAANLSANKNRFTAEQYQQLEETGEFVWMRYRAGLWPERPERRPYRVTREDMARHATRTLAHLEHDLHPCSILNLHGKSDGTVPADNSTKMDQTIAKSRAAGDLMFLEGVGHNWDQPGQPDLLVTLISNWIKARLVHPIEKPKDGLLVDHLGTQRSKA